MRQYIGRDQFLKNGGGDLRKGVTAQIVKEIVGDTTKMSAVISTSSLDRDGDTIRADGWDLDNYKANPVILFAHKSHELPVARSADVFVRAEKLHQQHLDFTPREVYEFGYTVGKMLELGYLNAFSVGFSPIEWTERSDGSGIDFHRQELLENSIVPVPANPQALIEAKAKLDTRSVKAMRDWMELALDTWEETDGLLIPKSNLEQAYKVCTGAGCTITQPKGEKMSKKFKALTFAETMRDMELSDAFWEAYRVLDNTIWDNMEAVRNNEIDPESLAMNIADAAAAFADSLKADIEEEMQEGAEPEQNQNAEGDVKKAAISYDDAHPDGTPKAPEGEEWDGPAEVAAAEVEDLKVMCAWVDEEAEDVKQGYKLPHHKADGEHTLVWRGVTGAMGALLGARGGVQIPESDRQGVYDHLSRHYSDFDREAPEFRMLEEGEEFDFETGLVVKSQETAVMKELKALRTEVETLKAVAGAKPQKSSDDEIAAYVKEVTVEVLKEITGKLD